jgi:alkanesulfonate monooxygenase SsuD/methylene tetrahydromethanopterin reductase-like flavin-dependent oxidoreductase (luciferase family)
MRISLFMEIPVPRPWTADSERQAFQEHLEQVELADKIGISTVWVTEHHFLEEYCHASAPEIFLAAASQRTERIRLGHGIMHLPPNINHPARVAERVATLDLVSNGRVEFGTGESSSVAELDGFQVDPGKKREMWTEAIQVVLGCMCDTPFAGFKGEFVDMPPRNVVPKPLQTPHPPVWIACTRRSTVGLAARSGIGCLSFSHQGPGPFKEIVDEYYSVLESSECVPLARAVNANVLSTVGGMICADTEDQAIAMLGNTARFFGYGIGHYYLGDQHKPGATDLWANYEKGMADDTIPGSVDRDRRLVGPPEKLRDYLKAFEDIGADEVMFLAPPIAHADLMASLEKFGRDVLPEFIERDEKAAQAKAKRLEPIIEAAMARRPPDPQVDPAYEFGGIAAAWDNQTPVSEIIEAMSQVQVDQKYAER